MSTINTIINSKVFAVIEQVTISVSTFSSRHGSLSSSSMYEVGLGKTTSAFSLINQTFVYIP